MDERGFNETNPEASACFPADFIGQPTSDLVLRCIPSTHDHFSHQAQLQVGNIYVVHTCQNDVGFAAMRHACDRTLQATIADIVPNEADSEHRGYGVRPGNS